MKPALIQGKPRESIPNRPKCLYSQTFLSMQQEMKDKQKECHLGFQ